MNSKELKAIKALQSFLQLPKINPLKIYIFFLVSFEPTYLHYLCLSIILSYWNLDSNMFLIFSSQPSYFFFSCCLLNHFIVYVLRNWIKKNWVSEAKICSLAKGQSNNKIKKDGVKYLTRRRRRWSNKSILFLCMEKISWINCEKFCSIIFWSLKLFFLVQILRSGLIQFHH